MHQEIRQYLRDMHVIHASGAAVAETSYYPALAGLFNAVGSKLQPRVAFIQHVRNIGAGIPDAGLFTEDQLKGDRIQAASGAQLPARGAVEIKPPTDVVTKIVKTEQVRDYVERYDQVLVTNYRDFLIVDHDHAGEIRQGERFTLASSATEFWDLARDPASLSRERIELFAEFLHRSLIRTVSLTKPQDVAFLLASYARDVSARLEGRSLGELVNVRRALESNLGLKFETERGEHFFRSTVVQTLFYGMFSAWVLWSRGERIGMGDRDVFPWRLAGWYLRVPVVGALFDTFAAAGVVKHLGLADVLDWAGEMLNRIDRAAFFARFQEEHAVQYFYEPFLEAFDPELRKQLGVWYTPPEIVEYMVERVDTVLRTELGIRNGLADPSVYVLDPCTGTGSYLVAVLRRIRETLAQRGEDDLLGADLKAAATTRLFGFELLPAPFVVAHLQIGLYLQSHGVPLADEGERAGVYLTNALTGWGRTSDEQKLSLEGALGLEREAAAEVKRERRILVVIGNPPYNGYAGIARIDEERDLTDAYRIALRTKQPQGQGLNDLYVRFFRVAERRIVERTGQGVVCLISNSSWLDGLSFTAMRERYLDEYDQIWIDNLNGDKYKTGKLTPEGTPDPSIFSTERNREGIQVGTAIALMVRRKRHVPANDVHFRNLWGTNKHAQLIQSAHHRDASLYERVEPSSELGYPFVPSTRAAIYVAWPLLPELFPTSFPGVKTSRDDVMVDIDRDRLIARMRRFFDPAVSNAEIAREMPGAMESTARFNAPAVRSALVRRGFKPECVIPYAYRPFDVRWLYWEPETKLLDEKREDYRPHVFPGNATMVTQQKPRREWSQPQVISAIGCLDLMDRGASCFPRLLRRGLAPRDGAPETGHPNLGATSIDYVDDVSAATDDLFFHALAVLHAPAYRTENAGALRQDWPRVPLPVDGAVLRASATLGRQLTALLDVEQSVKGVTTGVVRPELRALGAVTSAGAGAIDPATDLALAAGWGRGGNGQPVMPGRGRAVKRPMTAEEQAAIETAINPLGLALSTPVAPLGAATYDIYLNDRAYWRHVPERVWEYTLGGYQVLKKWLSYREEPILGRPLRVEEAKLFREVTRRIAAILLLEGALDANYARAIRETWDWQPAAAARDPARGWQPAMPGFGKR